MALTDKQHPASFNSLKKSIKPNVLHASANSEKVWMIVRRGQRRMLVEVDLNSQHLPVVEKSASRIPCCPVGSRYSCQPENVSCFRGETSSSICAVLRNRPSKIPKKPQNSQCNRGESNIHFKNSEDEDEDNKNIGAVPKADERFLEMGKRIQHLRERMDHWSCDLKQWCNQMGGRVKKLHRQLDMATTPRIFNAIVRLIVLVTGRSLITHAVLTLFTTKLPNPMSGNVTTKNPERNALECKLRFLQRRRSDGHEETSTSLQSDMLTAFSNGMMWVKTHGFSNNDQHTCGGSAHRKTANCQRFQRNQNSLRPLGIAPLGKPYGVNKSGRWTIARSATNAPGPSSGGLYREILSASKRKSKSSSSSSSSTINFLPQSEKLPEWITRNICFRSALIKQETTAKAEPQGLSKLYPQKPCFSGPGCHPVPHTQMSHPATLCDGHSTNSDKIVLSESLLETIKPGMWHSPLSHLEAEPDKTLLHPDMLWSSGSGSGVNSSQTFWNEHEHTFVDTQIRSWSPHTIGSDGKESDGSDDTFFGSESSIENPFYDSLDLLDTWDEETLSREAKWLYLSPNLAYGCEDVEGVADAREVAVQGEVDEIKTKWISVNDFILV